jgi:C4-dicarboxylate transporter, DctQ subunit
VRTTMGKVRLIFDRLLDVGAFCSGILLIFIMLSTCYAILARNVGITQIWQNEIAEYCMLYITFLGTAWLLRIEGHVKMDIVINALNAKARTFLGILTSIVGSIMTLVLVIVGFQVTINSFVKGAYESTSLLTPTFLIQMIIPIGSIFLCIQFMRRTYGYIKEMRKASLGDEMTYGYKRQGVSK